MKAAALVLPMTPEELAQLGALAHEISELRRKALTALAFGLHEQAGELAGEAQLRAAELLVLCAQIATLAPPPPPTLPALRAA